MLKGGLKQNRAINYLQCPTSLKRSIEFHGVFLKLSHDFWSTSLTEGDAAIAD